MHHYYKYVASKDNLCANKGSFLLYYGVAVLYLPSFVLTVCVVACFQTKEREMLQQLEKKEEKALNLQENYVSLQQEVDIKTKKLKKVTDYVGLLLGKIYRENRPLSPKWVVISS